MFKTRTRKGKFVSVQMQEAKDLKSGCIMNKAEKRQRKVRERINRQIRN